MAFIEDPGRVAETTTSTGSGVVALAGALAGYQSFATKMSVGDTFPGAIVASDNTWQEGIFTYSAANQITFTTVLDGSSGTTHLTLPAGTHTVFAGFLGMGKTISNAPAKTVPTGSDLLALWDAAVSAFKSLSLTNLKALIAGVVRSGRTSNTILAAGDHATLIDATTGGFTQTYTAAATLGSGWNCRYKNSSTGNVTHDPNASETIDGATTLVQYPGETWFIQCDGSGFNIVREKVGAGGYFQAREEQTSGTAPAEAAGGITQNANTTRTLNTVVTNTIPGASLSASLFTLPAGTYRIKATTPISSGATVKGMTVLTKDPAGTPVITLTGVSSEAATGTVAHCELTGRFTVAASAAYGLQTNTSSASVSGGVAATPFGSLNEVYSTVEIWKEA